MAGRSIATQDFLLQGETTPGTAVTNDMRRYLALKARPGWDGAAEPFAGTPGKIPTSLLLMDETGRWAIDGVQDFNALGAVAASRISMPVTSATADPAAFQHVFTLNPDGEDTKRTYTAQWGDTTQAVQAAYGVFNSLGLNVQRGQLGFSTSFLSKAASTGATLAATNEVQTVTITGTPTGGFFKLIFLGFTTADIAWNAAASAVDSALELLPSIGVGGVTVGGGPGPGTPYTVTFTGINARKNVPLMTMTHTLTGGAAPTVTITQTTPGNPTDIAAKPIPPRAYDVYADDTWATLGTTKLLAAYEANINLGDKFAPDTPINSTLVSFESLLEAENQDYGSDLRLGFDATAVSLMGTFAAGALKFLRWAVTGPLIGTGVSYLMQFDCCMGILSRGEVAAAPNSPAVTIPFRATQMKDPISGQAVRLLLINTTPNY